MPALDRLTDGGSLFQSAFSNAPFTHFSIPSFHTSNYIGNNAIGDRPTIASTLSAEGITTATLGVHTGSRSVNHGLGFDEYQDLGREYYEESGQMDPDHSVPVQYIKDILAPYPTVFKIAKKVYDIPYSLHSSITPASGWSPTIYSSAEELTDKALKWIETNGEDDFFLWIHYLEGHRPYGLHDPDPRYGQRISLEKNKKIWDTAGEQPDDLPVSDWKLLIDQYDSNLRYCSRHLNRLFDGLESQGIWDNTNILFTSDHGEEFYDHGMFSHHNIPYDELIHVPLIVKSNSRRDNQYEGQRELIDIGPTILNFFDVDIPGSFNGKDIFNEEVRTVISRGSWQFDRSLVAVRSDNWKYISTDSTVYLFDLTVDPNEERNVAKEYPNIIRKLHSLIPAGLEDSVPEDPGIPENEKKREQLEALGYI
jgi:arylsulfatase A-like enzyme